MRFVPAIFLDISRRLTVTSNLTTLLLFLVYAPFTSAMADKLNYVYPEKVIFSETQGPNGDIGNPLLRLVETLFSEANLDMESRQLPISRMLQQLSNETGNFAILVKSPTIKKCCVTSDKPVFHVELRVYHHKDKPAINRIEDLIGKKIITIQGYSYGPLYDFFVDEKNNLDNHIASSHRSAFAMLAVGRADYLIDYEGPSIRTLASFPPKSFSFEVLQNLNLYLILNKNRPGAESLMQQLSTITDRLDTTAILNFPRD